MRAKLTHVLRHPVASNALWLYAQQIALTLLPLVTLPYLSRVLGPESLGIVVFTQAFGFTLALVVDYGFHLSASREVAARREDPDRLADAVAGVQGAKALLCGACVALALAAWSLVPAFAEQPELLALGLLTALLQGMSPWWFLGGMEYMRKPAMYELGLRLGTVAALLALVDDAGDAALVLAIYLVAQALSTVPLMAWMYRLVAWRAPTRALVSEAMRSGWVLFVASGAVVAYTSANVFLLGLLVPVAQVAFFAAADRVVRAGIRVLSAVMAAVYPRTSFLVASDRADRADRLALVTLLALEAVAVLCALGLVVLAPLLVEVVFGPRFEPTVEVLRILAALLPLALAAAALGQLWLLPRGLERYPTRVTLLAGALSVGSMLLVTPRFGIVGAAWALIAVEVLTVTGNLAIMWKVGLLRTLSLRPPPAPPSGTAPRARRGAGSSA